MIDLIQQKEVIAKIKIKGGEIMDTIRLFLRIDLDINLLLKSKIKWSKWETKNGIIYTCTYSKIRLVYYYNKFALTIETSATKFLYNDNSVNFNLSDLNKFWEELDLIIRIATKQKIISVKKWTITRLDLVNNYYCANKYDKMVYLNMLNRLSFCNCKKNNIKIYDTSVHSHNNSITYNFYSKSNQNNNCDDRILRLEIQYKNRSLNRLNKTDKIKSKVFEDVINDISSLNNIYKKNLNKLGLDKQFATKEELTFLLKDLHKNNLITDCIYKNMYSYFITQDLVISNSTINTYKKILATYNYSHLLLENKLSKKIDFLHFNLFTQNRPYDHKVNASSLLFLLLLLLTIVTETKIAVVFTLLKYYIDNCLRLPTIFNDS